MQHVKAYRAHAWRPVYPDLQYAGGLMVHDTPEGTNEDPPLWRSGWRQEPKKPGLFRPIGENANCCLHAHKAMRFPLIFHLTTLGNQVHQSDSGHGTWNFRCCDSCSMAIMQQSSAILLYWCHVLLLIYMCSNAQWLLDGNVPNGA
jgi:hypothetical protein